MRDYWLISSTQRLYIQKTTQTTFTFFYNFVRDTIIILFQYNNIQCTINLKNVSRGKHTMTMN